MKIRLFHKIGDGGEDSADVRRFIVEHDLQELIDFSNVKYEEAARDLFEFTGAHEAPVLLVDGNPVRGKAAIIDWLRTNLLRQRD